MENGPFEDVFPIENGGDLMYFLLNIQITHLERKMIFQTSMIMFHVNLPGCIESYRPNLFSSRKTF